MSNPKNPGGPGGSLPEDIAARAGLPRQEEIAHSLHAATDQAEQSRDAALAAVRARAGQAAQDATQTARDVGGGIADGAEATAREATEAGLDVRARVSGAADAARERVEEGLDRVSARIGAAREQAGERYDDARAWASERYDRHSRQALEMADEGYRRLRRGRSATEAFVSDNPLLVGVVGVAAGLLLGALLPGTRRERETLGPWADEARDQGLRYAREMTHRGRAFVETALDPDNLDRAARRAGFSDEGEDREGDRREGYAGAERTAHRL